MNILLTGANGQLGHAIRSAMDAEALISLGRAELDVSRLPQVREVISRYRPQVIINTAAWTDVDGAESDPGSAYRANALGPRNLAIACAEVGTSLVHISTDYVFDGASAHPYHEFHIPNPINVYGASKLAGEEAVRVHLPEHWIIRTSWLFHTIGRNFLRTMQGLASQGEIRVVDDQVGSPTFAPHLARAILEVIRDGCFGTWHLSSNGSTSWAGLAERFFEEAGLDVNVIPVSSDEFPRLAKRPKSSVLSSLSSVPGGALPNWEEGVRDFVAAERLEGRL